VPDASGPCALPTASTSSWSTRASPRRGCRVHFVGYTRATSFAPVRRRANFIICLCVGERRRPQPPSPASSVQPPRLSQPLSRSQRRRSSLHRPLLSTPNLREPIVHI
jgi:hypothetical protein